MADETLRFDIVGRDNASGAFSKVAGATKDMGDRMDVATRHAFALDEALRKQSAGARASTDATLASAKADKILADAEEVLSGRAIEAEFALRRQAAAAKDAGDKSEEASGGISALAGGGGIAGGGMGALIAAGGLLSPTLVTLGFGLGGLGLAAAGVAKNQDLMRQTLAPLKSEYSAFEKALQPTVLGDFNSGIRLAGHLLGDVQPIAQATGKALGGVLGQIDAEFQSGQWQQFFGFMAKNAGPDVQQLGGLIVDLTNDLPSLLEALQPVARALVIMADDAAKAAKPLADLALHASHTATTVNQGAKGFDAQVVGWTNKWIPGAKLVNGQITNLQHALTGQGDATKALTPLQKTEAAATAAQAAAMSKLNAQITTHIAKVLTLEGDEVTWKQAQQAATQAIDQNSHSLDGNSKSALAARSAIIQATSQVVKFADDSNTSTGALRRGSSALQDQIGWLERHAGKSKIAAQEIGLLRDEESKIKREIDQRINVTGSGRFTVAGSGLPGGIGHRTGAVGGRVPGFGGGDVHPYLLEGGEAIVPKHLTPAVAPFLKAQGVPGFAAGGIIPTYSGGIKGLGPWAVGNTQAALHGFDQSIASALSRELQSLSTSLGGVAPASGSALAAQNYAASLLSMYGWSQGQMSSLIPLWNQESGWSANAVNPSSGAYGIPQALPSVWGHPYALGDYKNQDIWGLNYIRQRYGSPAGAWAHEVSAGWYGNGLDAVISGPTLIGVGERGPEHVKVTPGGRSAGGNTNITINVNVPPTVNPGDAGRQIADLLKQHIKRGGGLYPSGVKPR